jgi:hypothetical protein
MLHHVVYAICIIQEHEINAPNTPGCWVHVMHLYFNVSRVSRVCNPSKRNRKRVLCMQVTSGQPTKQPGAFILNSKVKSSLKEFITVP